MTQTPYQTAYRYRITPSPESVFGVRNYTVEKQRPYGNPTWDFVATVGSIEEGRALVEHLKQEPVYL